MYIFYHHHQQQSSLLLNLYNLKNTKAIPSSSLRDSSMTSGHSRSSGSFGCYSRMSDGMNAELFENGWDKCGFTDRLQTITHRDDQEKVETIDRCYCIQYGSGNGLEPTDDHEGTQSIISSSSSNTTNSISPTPFTPPSQSLLIPPPVPPPVPPSVPSPAFSPAFSPAQAPAQAPAPIPLSTCRYGSCYLLQPIFHRFVHLHSSQSTSRILSLPLVPHVSKPVIITTNEDGILESWDLNTLLKIWSLNLCDSVSFLGCTSFAVSCKKNHSPTPDDAPIMQSWVSHNTNASYSQSFNFTEDTSILLSSENTPATTRCEGSFVNLQDLDEKKDDTNSLVRLLVIGTQRGRLLILEEEEGNVLFDTFVMDGSLDKILISQLYSYKNNDQMMTGFVLTCINYNAHIFYSLLLSSSPNQSQSQHDSIVISPVTPESIYSSNQESTNNHLTLSIVDDVSTNSSVTLVDQASHSSTDTFLSSSHFLILSTDSQEISYFTDSFAGLFYCDTSLFLTDSISYYEDGCVDKLRICIPQDEDLLLFDLQGQQDSITSTLLKIHHHSNVSMNEQPEIQVDSLNINVLF